MLPGLDADGLKLHAELYEPNMKLTSRPRTDAREGDNDGNH